MWADLIILPPPVFEQHLRLQLKARLLRFRREGLCPHGRDNGVVGVTWVEEHDGHVMRLVRPLMSPVRFQPTKFLSLIGCYWDLLPWYIGWGLHENR